VCVCERDLESWPGKKWQISWLKAESLCSIFKFRLESVACESVQIIQLAKREIKLKKKTCSKPSADCTRECVCGCLCGAEKKKGERKGRMQLTTTSSMSIIWIEKYSWKSQTKPFPIRSHDLSQQISDHGYNRECVTATTATTAKAATKTAANNNNNNKGSSSHNNSGVSRNNNNS